MSCPSARAGRWVAVVCLLAAYGCTGPSVPLEMTSLDPSQDQWKIAQHYSHEAAGLRQKAEDFSNRALVYEQLFGRDSEWVAGARLLAQFYQEEARERERLAGSHVGVAGGRPPLYPPGLPPR